ncbi:MAG: hypothetical protein K2P84_06105 [Undibacterium sp.]|nr:hypothetical protein [Undibacterium sp.]
MNGVVEILKGVILITIPLLIFAALYRLVLRQRAARLAAQYEVLLKLAEKGAEIPLGLLDQTPDNSNSDLRRGLILICSGAGLTFFLLTLPEHVGWAIGFIPISAGIGYLLSWKLTRKN